MRSLESQANDEFLFVSNQVTFSVVDEDETHISSFGISKKIANLGSIPINLPPSQKLLGRIPSSATPSRALSPPLPPELVDLLPLSLRNHSTDGRVLDLDLLSTDCLDPSTSFRTSTGSSNYDYINDLVITNEDLPPPVVREGEDSLFSNPSICLDDSIHVNKSDTVKSDSSISTTTSTMSSSSSLNYGKENGMNDNVEKAGFKTPCVKSSRFDEDVACKNGNYFAVINGPSSEKLRSVTIDNKNCNSLWKNSQVRQINSNYLFKSRENVNDLNYPQRMSQVHPSAIPLQHQRRDQISANFYRSVEGLAGNKLVALTDPNRDGKKSYIFNLPTDFCNNYDAFPTSVFPKKTPKHGSDGIYDNLQAFRKEETVKVKSQTPLPYRRKMNSTIKKTRNGITSQSLQCILDVGKTESHLIIPCETCSYTIANSGRSRSCERSKFSPPGSPMGSPQLGRKPVSPWKNRSEKLPPRQISETRVFSVNAKNAFVDQREIYCNDWNPVQTNHIFRNNKLNPQNPNLNLQDQLHPSKPSPLFINDEHYRFNVQNNKETGKLKSNTFYKCVKNWLKKSQ